MRVNDLAMSLGISVAEVLRLRNSGLARTTTSRRGYPMRMWSGSSVLRLEPSDGLGAS